MTANAQRRMMAGYDTGTLTISREKEINFRVQQHDILRLTAPNLNEGMLGAMDAFDHDLGFEGEVGSLLDDVPNGLPSLPFTPSYELDAFSSTFEDPFSYQSNPFDSLLDSPSLPPNSTSNQETTDHDHDHDPDNKLLSFGAPILKCALLDDRGQTWPSLSAELYGMFFVAEDVFGDNQTTTGRPMELTCYRRNLFQISGTVTLSRGIKYMINEQGQQVPIYDLQASISALESIEGKNTEIISVPWKTGTASTTSEDKNGAAPPKWPLDLSMNPELDPSVVSIPIAWKRLQFKHATANNGRRKGLQQHYVIQINLMATTVQGEQVKLAEIQSGAIIVRGRSPRNFDSRRDVPLSEKKIEGKGRTMSDSSQNLKPDPGLASTGNGNGYKFYGLGNTGNGHLDIPDWTSTATDPTATTPRQTKKTLTSTSISSSATRPPVPKTKWSSSSSITPTKPSHTSSLPIDLSLSDDPHSHPTTRSLSHSSASTGAGAGFDKGDGKGVGKGQGSPIENVELLYEYFPLSVDDWMPPVDAIYRPHVVHHTKVPEDIKASLVRGRKKRYFTGDD